MVGPTIAPVVGAGDSRQLEPLLVTPTRGLKRLGLGLAALAAVGIAAFAAVPLIIRADAVREAVNAEIRFVTGLDPVLRGDAAVSLFPTGTATFSDVILGGEPAGSPALAAERLTTRLRFLPLLLGRIEVADVTLLRPKILISLDPAGHSNWSTLVTTLTRTLKPGGNASERGMSFSEIRIVGGTVLVHDESRGLAETLDGVELSLAWPSISKSFGATGQFVWRGEKIDASVSLGDFFSALKGERSGFKLRMAGSLLKAAFDGQLSHHPTLKIEGTLAADSPSLRNALRWAGLKPLPGGGLGPFALKAQTNVISNTVAFSGVNVELDGNAAEGVLTLIADGRPLLQGTLAAEEIDVAPYVSTVELLAANERSWSRTPILLDGLTGFDMDLRLSAARIALTGTKVGRTAVAAGVRNGRFTVTIGESQAFGGVVKGSMGIARAERGADVKAQLQFTDVDLESAIATVFGVRRLEGRGNLALAIDASGSDVFALTRAAQRLGHADGGARRPDRRRRRATAAPARAQAIVRRRRVPQRAHAVRQARHNGQGGRRHRHRRRRTARRRRHSACARRIGFDSRARPQPEGRGDPGQRAGQGYCHPVRAAVRGARPLGRSDHAAGRAKLDPPLGRSRAAARCGARRQGARCGPLRDRADDARRRAAASGGSPKHAGGARGFHSVVG